VSLAIDIDKVEGVLLADGWHDVDGASFTVDVYEFVQGEQLLVGGGQVAGVPSTGATWRERNGDVLACPLTAILAVRWKGEARGLSTAAREAGRQANEQARRRAASYGRGARPG